MSRFIFYSAILVASISTLLFINSHYLQALSIHLTDITTIINTPNILTSQHNLTPDTNNHIKEQDHMSNRAAASAAKTMAKSTPLRHAKITAHRSAARGHADHGWLNTHHSFSFAGWHHPDHTHFGALRVLNEDRVRARSGFPTHPHRDFEIFSYVLSGELTHRDSMLSKGNEGGQSDKFYRMGRGDVQFTTGGTGIAHSEMNEHERDTVHFLQIWAIPWKRGLQPRYHTRSFGDDYKRRGFVSILSPLKGGVDATAQQERDAEPTIPGTIPIHADMAMGAGIIAPGAEGFEWVVGAKATEAAKRKVYVHLPMTKAGKARIRIDGREDVDLGEGDGAYVDAVNAGDKLVIESIGDAEAEVIVLDTA